MLCPQQEGILNFACAPIAKSTYYMLRTSFLCSHRMAGAGGRGGLEYKKGRGAHRLA